MFGLKQLFKKIIQKFLEILVKIKLFRTNPSVIGITGSFGKTTAKEAVYEVLKTKWSVYRNPKSLNTEIGLLLAILEQPTGFSSPFKWAKIIIKAFINAFTGKKYDFLVLEYGADKPGDIKHLVSLIRPDIAVITHIARVHQDKNQFKSAEDVFDEKKLLALSVKKSGFVILNKEDKFLKTLAHKVQAKIFWFAVNNKNADVYAENLINTKTGFSATIHMNRQKARASFKIAGAFHITSLLPALIIGETHGISLKEGVSALGQMRLPPGRMSIIEGKHSSVLLDSSYNASPESMKQALKFLHDFPGNKKIAVLGNMNELGAYAPEAHGEVAQEIGHWLDMLITVGDLAKIIADQALKKSLPESKIKTFKEAESAGDFLLSQKLSAGDTILFKGSQNRVRLERAVKMLMAHPEDSKKLLCRQEPEWEKIE